MSKGGHFRKILREMVRTLNREFRIALTPVPSPERWAFIVGCYNSGTTLLAEALGRHPAISSLPTEGQFITREFLRDYDVGLPRMWVNREDLFRLDETSTGPDVERLKREWGMRLDLRKPVLLEKSPPNAAKTRWLNHHFENAHFICLVRNGYAVAEGIRRKAKPHHLKDGWSIGQAAHQWARSNEILLEDSEHLDNVLWIRYEDMTEDPARIFAEIFRFLKVDPDVGTPEAETYEVHERSEQISNLNDQSIGRLSDQDILEINRVAGEILDRLGYEVFEPGT